MEKWYYLISSELLGTFTLGLLGGSISANIVLKNTKCSGSTAFTAAFGWGISIMTSIFFAIAIKGVGHLNPIVTIAMAIADDTGKLGFGDYEGAAPAVMMIVVLLTQFIAYFLAQIFVDIIYWGHIKDALKSTEPEDAFSVLSIHTSAPTHETKLNISSFIAEMIASIVFLFALLFMLKTFSDNVENKIYMLLKVFLVTLTVIVVLMGLGGVTGPSINPSREIAVALVYIMIPVQNKPKVKWSYIWVPLTAPLIGAIFAGLFYRFVLCY